MTAPVVVRTALRRPDVRPLRRLVASLLEQAGDVAWVAHVGNSTGSPAVAQELADLASVDDRFRVGDVAAGAAGAVAIVAEGATLAPTALVGALGALRADPSIAAVFGDGATVERAEGWRPMLRPGWSISRARAQAAVGDVVVVRGDALARAGGLEPEPGPAEAHDLLLRVADGGGRIERLPQVLALRVGSGSTTDAVPEEVEARRRATMAHLERCGIAAAVTTVAGTASFALRRAPVGRPVSIVIPTRGTARAVWGTTEPLVLRCVRSLRAATRYPDWEVLAVADPETPAAVLDELKGLGAGVVRATGPFSFSARCNLGASRARGDVLVFLNDDTVVEQEDWLHVLVGVVAEPGVGVAGAHLRYADGRLQHVGVLLNAQPLHLFEGHPFDERGPEDLLLVERDVSAVTAACMAVERTLFEQLGGFAEDLAVAFNDVDLCLRARRVGQRVVVTPHCTLYHLESQSRPRVPARDEAARFFQRWATELVEDPWGHPGLAPKDATWRPRPSVVLRGALSAPAALARDARAVATPSATLAARRSTSRRRGGGRRGSRT